MQHRHHIDQVRAFVGDHLVHTKRALRSLSFKQSLAVCTDLQHAHIAFLKLVSIALASFCNILDACRDNTLGLKYGK